MPPDRQRPDYGSRNSSWQRTTYTPIVNRSFVHYPCDSTIWLVSTPVLRENTLGRDQGSPNYLPLPPTTREDLRLNGYLEYRHAAKALYIYKHPCLLRIRTQDLRNSCQRR
ncbi:uncharacterized protein TNCV_4132351 [Trichonephila clavipes]|nr:uncharacterized protein TNCV_4132351 [Trichonephila clavipes]